MSPTRPPTTASEARSAAVARLAAHYWDERLRADPVEGTFIGERRFDHLLGDLSPAGMERRRERLVAFRHEAEALASDELASQERITHAVLLEEIDAEVAQIETGMWRWTVDPRTGPQVTYMNLGHMQTIDTPERGEQLLARWNAIAAELETRAANLRAALADGEVATRESVARVVSQFDALLAKPAVEWPLCEPARANLDAWPAEEAAKFRAELPRVVTEVLRPAFARHREVLAGTILPAARGDELGGLCHVPRGAESYRRLARLHTTTELDATTIHARGLEAVARVRDELRALGERLFGTSDLARIQARLRGDRQLFFATREEVEAVARDALARAEAAIPAWFGRLPATRCEVKRLEGFEEKDAPLAYYRQPAVDGSRPGTYYINTFAPETRSRYEAEVLAFHESIPGHHLQIALAQEMPGLPDVRKHALATAYVEGWALYTERLADEMGLYSDDLSRMGMLGFDAWRASRLVVDTGLHAFGWTRAQADRYTLENTVLTAENIDNEVDRYIGWPGQALAYKLGQLEITALRDEARQRLGGAFTLPAFHDLVLGTGAVPLGVLRQEVARWPSP
jgi:uncharacterized protein (DUF885 family)